MLSERLPRSGGATASPAAGQEGRPSARRTLEDEAHGRTSCEHLACRYVDAGGQASRHQAMSDETWRTAANGQRGARHFDTTYYAQYSTSHVEKPQASSRVYLCMRAHVSHLGSLSQCAWVMLAYC
jgi:hypothetical protein